MSHSLSLPLFSSFSTQISTPLSLSQCLFLSLPLPTFRSNNLSSSLSLPFIFSVAHTFTPVSPFCSVVSSSISLCYLNLSITLISVSPIFHFLCNTVSYPVSSSSRASHCLSLCLILSPSLYLSLSLPVLGAAFLRVLLSPPCLYCPAGKIISILRGARSC